MRGGTGAEGGGEGKGEEEKKIYQKIEKSKEFVFNQEAFTMKT